MLSMVLKDVPEFPESFCFPNAGLSFHSFLKKNNMADDLLMTDWKPQENERHYPGGRVRFSVLLHFSISPCSLFSFGCLSESSSTSLVAEVSDLMIYSRGAGKTELRFGIKEIRTGEVFGSHHLQHTLLLWVEFHIEKLRICKLEQ